MQCNLYLCGLTKKSHNIITSRTSTPPPLCTWNDRQGVYLLEMKLLATSASGYEMVAQAEDLSRLEDGGERDS
jgi:hypothetical protein